MTELYALEASLRLALRPSLTPLEIECESTEAITLLDSLHSTHVSTVHSCRLLLRNLGNLVVRHNFREGNQVVDLLANMGSGLSYYGTTILTTPPVDIEQFLQEDKHGVVINRSILSSVFEKLAALGNMNVLPSLHKNSTSNTIRVAMNVSTVPEKSTRNAR